MDCRTCDHKTNRVAANVFWCPRCGTTKTLLVPVDSDEIVGVPTLVGSAKCLMRDRPNDAGIASWLDDCVSIEEERKKYGGD